MKKKFLFLGEKKKKLKGMIGGIIGLIFGILLKFIKTQKIVPDITLKEGDFIGGLTVISCPGHTGKEAFLYIMQKLFCFRVMQL